MSEARSLSIDPKYLSLMTLRSVVRVGFGCRSVHASIVPFPKIQWLETPLSELEGTGVQDGIRVGGYAPLECH